MANSGYQYQTLSTREGFNRSLKHFRVVSGIIPDLEENTNLSDLLNEMVEEKKVATDQVTAILRALLVDKYGYVGRSHNMTRSVTDFQPIVKETAAWTAVDLVVLYFHPDLGVQVVNPKSLAAWTSVQELRRNELMSVYAGGFGEEDGPYAEAAGKLIDLVEGRKVRTPSAFKGGSFKAPKPGARVRPVEVEDEAVAAPAVSARPRERTDIVVEVPAALKAPVAAAPAAVAVAPAAPVLPAGPAARRKMTPMISIPVTNELFHNGNVEAWKRIIQSYTTKYPNLEVYVFYDGERIQDINTLFKWGKVKHGSTILVSVAGDPATDVAKLRRYLSQGASIMFEAFLRFPVNTILPLF